MNTTPHVTIEELLAQHEWATSLARCLVHGDAQVDDVVQQAYVRALSSSSPPTTAVRPWLGQVIRNVVRRGWQQEQRERARLERVASRGDTHPAAADVAEHLELQRRLVTAVLALKEPYQSVILLRFFEDMPPRDVAVRLGAPVETVRTRTRRALEILREQLGEAEAPEGESWLSRASVWLAASTRPATPTIPTPRAARRQLSATLAVGLFASGLLLLGGAALAWTLSERAGDADEVAALPAAKSETSVADAGASAPGGLPTPPSSDVPKPLAPSPELPLIRGLVLRRETREPVGNAIVRSRVGASGSRAVAEAKTHADGRFELSFHPAATGEASWADTYSDWLRPILEVRTPNCAVARKMLTFPRADKAGHVPELDLGEIEVERGSEVSGRVVRCGGATEEVVPGAELYLCYAASTKLRLENPVPVGRSGNDGSFTLEERVAPRRERPWQYELMALGPDGELGWAGWTPDPDEAMSTVEVHVPPTAQLDVNVTGLDGLPAAGCPVAVRPLFQPICDAAAEEGYLHVAHNTAIVQLLQARLRNLFLATTDASGHAVFPRLPLACGHDDIDLTPKWIARANHGTFSLCAGAGATGHGDSEVFDLETGKPEVVAVTLRRSASASELVVSGRVTWKAGAPATGAQVSVNPGFMGTPAVATAASDGSYVVHIPDFVPNPALIECQATAEGAAPQPLACQLPPSLQLKVDFELLPLRATTGLVVDEAGQPLAVALVTAQPVGGTAPDGPLATMKASAPSAFIRAQSDAQGRFTLANTSEGRWQLVVFPKDTHHFPVQQETVVDAGSNGLRIVVPHMERRLASARIRVVGSAGEPAETCEASIQAWGMVAHDLAPAAGIEEHGTIVHITDLSPGRWRLWVLGAGELPGFLDLDVAPEDDGRVLEGVVRVMRRGGLELQLDTGGEDAEVTAEPRGPQAPLNGAAALPHLTKWSGSWSPAAGHADGTLRIGPLMAGDYQIKVVAGARLGLATAHVTEADTAHVDVAMESCGFVELRGIGDVVTWVMLDYEDHSECTAVVEGDPTLVAVPAGTLAWTSRGGRPTSQLQGTASIRIGETTVVVCGEKP